MGEVLRPREGERPDRRRVPHPSHRRSPPSDNHWPRVCATGSDRPCRGQEPPVRDRRHCRRPPGGDPTGHRSRLAVGLAGVGPGVADRGAFPPVTQGGSLLASNDPITGVRQADTARPHRVAPKVRSNGQIGVRKRTDPRVRFTASNSAYFCQVLVKHRRPLSSARENGRGAPGGTTAVLSHQNKTRARAVLAAVTLGSSGPITSKSSKRRTRTASRSSPKLRRTVSTSRPKASST